MDETDVKILKQILSDARSSYRKIGEKIGVSPPTVLSRVQKLEKNRIIRSYSAVLDHAITEPNPTPAKEETIAAKVVLTNIYFHISTHKGLS